MGKGFTLVELLVAISIMIVISTIGFASYANSQLVSRDAKRKQDLRSIYQALELYRESNTSKTYPVAASWVYSSASQPWIPALDSKYINLLPKDPLKKDAPPLTAGNYGYAYWSGPVNTYGGNCPNDSLGGQFFILATRLENSQDTDRNGSTPKYKYCDNTTPISEDPAIFAITSQ